MATELLLVGTSNQLGSNLKNAVHPSLCPMLILLSRLKPSPISSETGDPLDPFFFMPFIRRCSVQSNFRIRVLASGALTGLVANEKLEVVLLNIASELPCEKSHVMTPDSSSISNSNNGTSCSFNSIHGMLLQLNALVDTNCRILPDSAKKDTILHELIQIIATRSWIGRPQHCPCPILNGSMLKLLDNMLSIAKTCEASRSAGVVWNLLWKLSSESLDLEPVDRLSYFDPTVQELRKQAATFYFNCVFQTSKEVVEDELLMRRNFSSPATSSLRVVGLEVAFSGFQERLIRSMSDASYEIRIATLKWLLLFLKRRESSVSDCEDQFYSEAINDCLTKINLQDTLMKLLVSEKHHKCIRYLLKLLYTWNSREFQEDNEPSLESRYACNMDCHSIFQLWNKLVSLFKITRHAKTRQTLVCCLGVCVKQISNLCMNFISSEVEKKKATELIQTDPGKVFSDFYDKLSYFVNLIEQNSDASEPVNMRNAAAESLIASGLLAHAELLGSSVSSYPISDENPSSHFNPKDAIRLYARKVLDLWLISIKLLEDEDVGLRKRLALDVQKYFSSRENVPLITASSQVEKVIELCFDHLSSIFGHWHDYLDYLCSWVMNIANSANYIVSGGDLVRRVFDKEIDNHHEEKLLICQLCCSQLEVIPSSRSRVGEPWIDCRARALLRKWRTRFSEQLIAFSRDHIGKRGSSDWIGGVGNHKDAFLPIYANLVAFYAVSNCILKEEPENGRSMISEVSAIGEAIDPFLGNPLISNLYLIVVELHEKCLSATADNLAQKWREDDSGWGELNPYFLLR